MRDGMAARAKRVIGGAVVALLGMLVRPAVAEEPSLAHYVIETPHFFVYFPENYDDWGEHVARVCESVYGVVTRTLDHEPGEKTHVVISDDTDSSNGSARVVPYNRINIFLTPPGPGSVLGDYDEWLYALLVHEFTHIVHLDTIGVAPGIINTIFGKTYAPNQIQPKWFIEGLAVLMETETTAGGRNRSSLFDMYLRTLVLAGRFRNIDEISSVPVSFPGATVWYLHGGRFLAWIAKRYGTGALTEMSHEYGALLVPYASNRTARLAVGKSFGELWSEWVAELELEYRAVDARVRSDGVREGKRLTYWGGQLGGYAISPDGKFLYYYASPREQADAIRRLNLLNGEEKTYRKINGNSGMDISPDGRTLIFSLIERFRQFYAFGDIFSLPASGAGKIERLTSGERAAEPVYSPDGKRFAYVRLRRGKRTICVASEAETRCLDRPGAQTQSTSPSFSPDGRHIAFSEWALGGNRDIKIWDLVEDRVTPITADRAQDLDPEFSPDGRQIFFSSDRTGVYNIYAYRLDGAETRQITNVITGAFHPKLGPDGRDLYYQGFHANGDDLYVLKLEPPETYPLAKVGYDRPAPPFPTVSDGPVRFPAQDYSPWPSVVPRTWFPVIGGNNTGFVLGASTSGSDVIGYHSYAASAYYHFEFGEPGFGAAYAYSRFYPRLTLQARRDFRQVGSVLYLNGEERRYDEEVLGAGIQLSFPFTEFSHDHRLAVGYQFDHLAARTPVVFDPLDSPPLLPETGNLASLSLSWDYADIESAPDFPYPLRGGALSANLDYSRKEFGSDFEVTRASVSARGHVPMPGFSGHVISPGFSLGAGKGEMGRRRFYSLGGIPAADLVTSILRNQRVGGIYLRGYPVGALNGDGFAWISAEYKMPLAQPEKGLELVPVYLRQIHMAVFGEGGDAYVEGVDSADLKYGMGAELRVEMVFFYTVGATLRVGYARALGYGDSTNLYFVFGGSG